MFTRVRSVAALCAVTLLLAACGGGGSDGGGSTPPPTVTAPTGLSYPSPQTYTVNTAISALSPTVAGTVTSYSVSPTLPAGLQLSANGQISGTPTAAAAQSTYVITASNSAGSTSFNLVITVNDTFTVGGTISGLMGAGLALRLNGGAELTPAANGAFTFVGPLPTGTAYAVTIAAQPGGQNCVLAQASGTIATANVTNVAITCTNIGATTYTIGGTVAGLSSGSLVLRNNGGDDLTVTSNGNFTFAQSLASAAAYAVTVATQPAGQTCTVSQGNGNVGSANITNVAVNCSAIVGTTFSISGTVAGLTSTPVVLQNNGGDSLSVSANGSFTFPTLLPSGANYSVTVATQPTGMTCQVGSGSGIVGQSNVSNVVVVCAGSTGSMGGTVLGLAGSGLRIHNGMTELAITGNGAFSFPGQFGAGINYHVYVSQAPSSPSQTCAIANGIGTTAGTDVTNIAIICANTPPAGRFVYVPNYFGSNISAWQVNQSTGALSTVVGGPFPAGAQLSQLVAHPSGQFLYGRAVTTDNNIRAFAIDQAVTPQGGALSAVVGSPFTVADGAGEVFLDRSGKWLIIASTTTPTLSMFAIDGTTGALSHVPGSPHTLTYNPGTIVFRPDSKFVYVADPSGNELFGYAIDATTGALTELSTPFFTSGHSVSAMTIDALGRFLYGSTIQGTMYVATIHSTTGELLPATLNNISVGNAPRRTIIDPLGRFLYVVLSDAPGTGAIAQFTIDQSTGVISNTGSSPSVGTGIGLLQNGLALRPDGRFMYAATLLTDLMYGWEINSTDGQLYTAPGHPFAVETGPNPPVMDPAGRFVFVSSAVNNNLSVYSTDLATGTLTPVPGSPYPSGIGPIGVVVVP